MVKRKIDTNDNGVADTWVEDGTCGEGCQVLPSSLAADLGIHFTCPVSDG